MKENKKTGKEENGMVIELDDYLAAQQKNWIQVPKAIVRNGGALTSSELHIWQTLYSYKGEEGIFVGQARMAAELGSSVKTVERIIKNLKEKGFVEVRKRGYGLTNIYKLCIPEEVLERFLEVQGEFNSSTVSRAEMDKIKIIARSVKEPHTGTVSQVLQASKIRYEIKGETLSFGEYIEQIYNDEHGIGDKDGLIKILLKYIKLHTKQPTLEEMKVFTRLIDKHGTKAVYAALRLSHKENKPLKDCFEVVEEKSQEQKNKNQDYWKKKKWEEKQSQQPSKPNVYEKKFDSLF